MKATKEAEPAWLVLLTMKGVKTTWKKPMKAMNRNHLEKHLQEKEDTLVENAERVDAVTTEAISVETIGATRGVISVETIGATRGVNTAVVAVNNAVESLIVSNSRVKSKKTSRTIAGTTTEEDHSNVEIYL